MLDGINILIPSPGKLSDTSISAGTGKKDFEFSTRFLRSSVKDLVRFQLKIFALSFSRFSEISSKVITLSSSIFFLSNVYLVSVETTDSLV